MPSVHHSLVTEKKRTPQFGLGSLWPFRGSLLQDCEKVQKTRSPSHGVKKSERVKNELTILENVGFE